MQKFSTDPARWAAKQFADCDLGDVRRTRRLVQVASALAQQAHGTLPGSFDTWAELLAAYRMMNTPAVTYSQILAPHIQQTRRALRRPGEYLIIEDTSDLNYTGKKVAEELGRIGNDTGQGLWLHSSLALTVHGYDQEQDPQVSLLGLFAQQYWRRDEPPYSGRETRTQRLHRRRESQRWAEAFETVDPLLADVHWTYLADRDSDVYEAMIRPQRIGADFIIRANQPRALEAEEGSVLTKVAAAKPLGQFNVFLRSRPGQAAHTARLEVRAVPVRVRAPYRPGGRRGPLALYVVEARQIGKPAGEPIHWVLLTNRPIRTRRQAIRAIRTYARRFLIEEYHKALKSGVHIEESELASLQGLQALLGILAVVAFRLLQWKLLAVADPQASVEVERVVKTILETKYGPVAEGWTIRRLLISIARLGGFPARKGDGMPGWQTLWRGWQRLMLMAAGYRMAHG